MKILHLYHDIMNLYGDYANISALKRLFGFSGIECNVDRITFTPVGGQASRGDINRDGNVSAADAVMLCKYLTGMEQLNGDQAEQADLDDNRIINVIDLTLLKRLLLRQ